MPLGIEGSEGGEAATGEREYQRAVSLSEDGQRIDVVLASWLSEPRAQVQQRLAAGEVTIDGAPVAKSRRVHTGERIRVAPPTPTSVTAVEGFMDAVPVRWEDEHLAVVVKPAGLVVHAGAGLPQSDRECLPGSSGAPTLVDALRQSGMPLAPGTDPARPGIVHRLDRGTSGVLVVAKTPVAYHGLARMFKAHAVDRRYWAIVDGAPHPPRATIDAPIARSAVVRTRFQVREGGRRAVSHYDVLEAFGRAATLEIQLETGRTHQVRVHLAAVGHPVAGDRTYGASPVLAAQLGLWRPALHARVLGLDHPVTGERIEVAEPLPADLVSALATLRASSGRVPD
jgi:23S rRNA pseudouridine1911/1915/1917 synthase